MTNYPLAASFPDLPVIALEERDVELILHGYTSSLMAVSQYHLVET